MGCHHFTFGNSHGIITLSNIYEYKGFTFEWHNYCGPVRVRKKNFEICKRPYGRTFLTVVTEWDNLSKEEKEKTRIYG